MLERRWPKELVQKTFEVHLPLWILNSWVAADSLKQMLKAIPRWRHSLFWLTKAKCRKRIQWNTTGSLLIHPIVSLKEHTWNGVWQHQENMYQLWGHWHKGEGAKVFGERSFTVRHVRETCEFGKTTTNYHYYQSYLEDRPNMGMFPGKMKNEEWTANVHTSRRLELINYHSSLQCLLCPNKCTHLWFWITGRGNI